MSSSLPRLARRMAATGGVVVAMGAAASLTTGTAVAATGTTTGTGTGTGITAASATAVADVKAPKRHAVKLSPRKPVVYPRGRAPRTTRHYTKIYIKVVKRQYNRPVRVRAIAPNGRPIGPWVTVPSRYAPHGKTVALTKTVRDGMPFKLQWNKSTAGGVSFYLFY